MKAMVLFSGGIDSTTCLGMAVDKYGAENVIALSISYGQKHTKEIEASDKIVKYYNVEHIYLDLAKIFQYSDCSLLSHSDKEIPKESYDAQIKGTDGKHYQRAVVKYIMVLMQMMLQEVHILTAAVSSTLL